MAIAASARPVQHGGMTRKTWYLVLAVFACWTINGLLASADLLTMRDAAGHPMAVFNALKASLVGSWLWAPFALGLLWLVRRFPIEPGGIVRALAVFSLAVAAIVVLRAVLIYTLNPWMGWWATPVAFSTVLARSIVNNVFLSWLVIGVGHALLFASRNRDRERQALALQGQLTEARLSALSSRLNPHFLFNALNSIAELVHRDPAAADRMIVGLSALLRSSLERSGTMQVPLHEELRLLGYYLDIEKVRLGSRLHVEWQIQAASLAAMVPPLLLQPLVENAVRHGISRRLTPGVVIVRAEHSAGRLMLEVHDDGGVDAPTSAGFGTGLSTTRARLECLYGANFSFELNCDTGAGTVARMVIPFVLMKEAA
jgi:signal transduction histidine kinase